MRGGKAHLESEHFTALCYEFEFLVMSQGTDGSATVRTSSAFLSPLYHLSCNQPSDLRGLGEISNRGQVEFSGYHSQNNCILPR